MTAPSLTLARAAGRLSRRLGRGGGTSLPGKLLLRMRPQALAELGGALPRGVTVISATNGKTTTARLVASCAREAGWELVANTSGANLLSGVATALLDAQGRRPAPEAGLFEVDEAALVEVARQLRPRVLLLMNLFRDQLDRYGELEHLAAPVGAMVAGLPASAVPVLNADDPAIAALGAGRPGVLTFGIDDPAVALPALPHAADSTRCRVCAAPLTYDLVTLGHLGHWRCDGLRRRAADARRAGDAGRAAGRRTASPCTIETPEGAVEAELPLPGSAQRLQRHRRDRGRRWPWASRSTPSRRGPRHQPGGVRARRAGRRSTAASWCCCWRRTRRAPTRPCAPCCSTPSRRTC